MAGTQGQDAQYADEKVDRMKAWRGVAFLVAVLALGVFGGLGASATVEEPNPAMPSTLMTDLERVAVIEQLRDENRALKKQIRDMSDAIQQLVAGHIATWVRGSENDSYDWAIFGDEECFLHVHEYVNESGCDNYQFYTEELMDRHGLREISGISPWSEEGQ
jgi:hypothetical protein